MTSESCAMMYFAGKRKPCQCDGEAPSSPNSTWNCDVWEHDYLQYSWIAFPHCSTVTAVSRVSVDKFLVSLVSNDHISYRDDFMLSLINTT